jgi:hypothetical protein
MTGISKGESRSCSRKFTAKPAELQKLIERRLVISAKEWVSLRSQFVTLDDSRGQHRKYSPLAFTEHGAFMAAAVLNSPRVLGQGVSQARVR